MSKLKNYIMTSVENQVDKITKDYIDGNIDLNTAENKIEDIDNLEMYLEKHNPETNYLLGAMYFLPNLSPI